MKKTLFIITVIFIVLAAISFVIDITDSKSIARPHIEEDTISFPIIEVKDTVFSEEGVALGEIVYAGVIKPLNVESSKFIDSVNYYFYIDGEDSIEVRVVGITRDGNYEMKELGKRAKSDLPKGLR